MPGEIPEVGVELDLSAARRIVAATRIVEAHPWTRKPPRQVPRVTQWDKWIKLGAAGSPAYSYPGSTEVYEADPVNHPDVFSVMPGGWSGTAYEVDQVKNIDSGTIVRAWLGWGKDGHYLFREPQPLSVVFNSVDIQINNDNTFTLYLTTIYIINNQITYGPPVLIGCFQNCSTFPYGGSGHAPTNACCPGLGASVSYSATGSLLCSCFTGSGTLNLDPATQIYHTGTPDPTSGCSSNYSIQFWCPVGGSGAAGMLCRLQCGGAIYGPISPFGSPTCTSWLFNFQNITPGNCCGAGASNGTITIQVTSP